MRIHKFSCAITFLLSILLIILLYMRVDTQKQLFKSHSHNQRYSTIKSSQVVAEQNETSSSKEVYTEEELFTLAVIIYQEAGSDACSDETRLLVGNVVLNRIKHWRYPSDIVSVATQAYQYGRLHWTGVQFPDRANNENEQHAVQRAYDIAQRLLEGERVCPDYVIYQAEFEQGDSLYAYQDNTYFCYNKEDME